jgi:cyanophycin synthetase
MRILGIRTITGPNVYSHNPVLVMRLDMEELAERETCEFGDFNDRLIALLPGLEEHVCGLGRRGGFIERLRGGTYFSHTTEHIALELTDAAGLSVNRGKTVWSGTPGVYLVAVEYKSEAGMRSLLTSAVDLVHTLLRGERFDVEAAVKAAKAVAPDSELGPSTRAIVDAAERRGIPWVRADEQSIVRLGYGKYRRYVESTIADSTRVIGVDIAGDKDLTKRFLDSAAIPVPRGEVVKSREEAITAFRSFKGPVVVKPLDGNQGKGVSLNLTTEQQVAEAYDIACGISPNVIVERMLRGRDFRLVVVGGKLVAASERMPAHVWGDGVHTIQELIDFENRNPARGADHEKPLTQIKVDPVAHAILKKYNRNLDDVPGERDLVLLRESANLSTGGSARDVTDAVHPSIRKIAERAARAVGLDVCGIDLVVEDITAPMDMRSGGIVEINAAPGIRMHHYPTQGQPRDVGAAIVDMLYPAGTPVRIPVISTTGTNGKTTVTRMIGHTLLHAGRNVGMTTTDGIWIGGEEIARGDMTGPWSAGVVLSDDSVDIAVLETARGGIFRSGLAYDWSDVSVMTNIELDHIGQDGIESIEDIVWIKQVVAERVREGGTLVLNADDRLLVEMSRKERILRVPKKIVFFSMDPMNTVIHEHVGSGGTAYVLNGEWIEEQAGGAPRRLIRAADIPVTLGGLAGFQVANAMAALAAVIAVGVDRDVAAAGLREFRSDRDNAGRMNLYCIEERYVLLDYAHNPAALQAICNFISRWPTGRAVGVLGLPGDRADTLLEQSARVAGCGLGTVILREDKDLRGRKPGEVPDMMRRVIASSYPDLPVEIVPDELDAIQRAVQLANPGDVIVVFIEKVAEAVEMLMSLGASPVTDAHLASKLDGEAIPTR